MNDGRTTLDQYNNDWYQPGGAIKRLLWMIVSAVFFRHSLAVFSGWKSFLLRMFGAGVGKGVNIKPSVHIKYPWFLKIGNHCWIGEGAWIDNLAEVKLGDHVCISQGAYLLTGNHNYRRPTFDLMARGITLEDGVWIGARSVVCPGVHCGSHSVLSVNSVATKNLEPYTIYQGNPAAPIKSRVIETATA